MEKFFWGVSAIGKSIEDWGFERIWKGGGVSKDD